MIRPITILALVAATTITAANARPARWCGWYARFHLVATDPGKSFDQACKWLVYGHATSPHAGAIAVWCSRNHRHVGKLVSDVDANGNAIVLSGNDGHAVRQRLRSIAGAQFRE